MTGGKARTRPIINQVLLFLMAAVLLFLAISFLRQVGVSYQRREELHRIEQDGQVLEQEILQLEAEREYLNSDAALRAWGLTQGLVDPEEQLVVTVGESAAPASDAGESLEEGQNPGAPRDVWLDLFFGTR
jgi:hypothetical protein